MDGNSVASVIRSPTARAAITGVVVAVLLITVALTGLARHVGDPDWGEGESTGARGGVVLLVPDAGGRGERRDARRPPAPRHPRQTGGTPYAAPVRADAGAAVAVRAGLAEAERPAVVRTLRGEPAADDEVAAGSAAVVDPGGASGLRVVPVGDDDEADADSADDGEDVAGEPEA